MEISRTAGGRYRIRNAAGTIPNSADAARARYLFQSMSRTDPEDDGSGRHGAADVDQHHPFHGAKEKDQERGCHQRKSHAGDTLHPGSHHDCAQHQPGSQHLRPPGHVLDLLELLEAKA